MKRTSVKLLDVDLSRLADSADPETAAAASAAAGRLAVVATLGDVPPHVAQLIADVVSEATTAGRLIWRHDSTGMCPYCQRQSEWKVPKGKRKKREYRVPVVDFADRPIFIRGHASVGACGECVEAARPHLIAALAHVHAQVPAQLAAPGRPALVRWDRQRCIKCGWSGHEGQMGKLRTLFNDGWYRGKCPSCGAERTAFGAKVFERVDGFDVAEDSP